MKQKLFLSHSSKQKKYVEKLQELVGYDKTVVDKYTFECGENLWQEIRRGIDGCDFFVYLISEEALTSKWVNAELGYVRDKIDEEKMKFYPFIIDPNVEEKSSVIPIWVKKYLLGTFEQPKKLARILERKIRRDTFEKYPLLKELNHLFIGRFQEMEMLERDYYRNVGQPIYSMIVSGFPHIGRKRILREFIASKVMIGGDPNDITIIKLTDTDSIQNFVMQLSDIICEYSITQLLNNMDDKKHTLNVAIKLLNRLIEEKEYIVISDERCIVQPNGLLTEWFVELITSKALKNHLHLCLASHYTPRPQIYNDFQQVVSLQLQPLKSIDMRTLFNAYASLMKLDIPSSETNFFINRFTGLPEQVFSVVDSIEKNGIPITKKNIDEVIGKYDNDCQRIVLEIKNDYKAFQVLILLSRFEFISYDFLCSICGENIIDIVESFHYHSLTELFGSSKQYICLNPAIIDYINRAKLVLSEEYEQRLKKATIDVLNDFDDSSLDLSQQSYGIKEILRRGKDSNDARYLIPSFALKVIIEEYNAKRDDNVITLADRILKGYRARAYEEVIRSITYWLCCALCRKVVRRFFNEVNYFNRDTYSYNFLNGFYYRHTRNYVKAKEFYKKALNITKRHNEGAYASKAEHEMVIVCIALGDYEEAFDLAQSSYEKNPYNTYHIEAYFRCLVRSSCYDNDTLSELMDKMKHSLVTNNETIYHTMEAEYSYYICNDFSRAIRLLSEEIERNHKNPYPWRSLKEICKSSDSIRTYNSLRKKYELSDNDENIDYEND